MKIRLLGKKDAADFRSIRLEGLLNSPEAFASSYQEEYDKPLAFFEKKIIYSQSCCMVGAFLENALIGTAGFFREKRQKTQHKGIIWGVYVCSQYRGKGIGRKILERLINEAAQYQNVSQVHIKVVTENIAAKKLYTSLGFQHVAYEQDSLRIEGRSYDEEIMVLFVPIKEEPNSGD